MRIIIIGGVAGGATTAARLRRLDEHNEIIIFEKGPHISYANCGLPYYIGGSIKERNQLFVQTPEQFGNRFNVKVNTHSEVIAINKQQQIITVKNVLTNSTYEVSYDKLVLSPGANAIIPPITGINLPAIFTIRNVTDTDKIKNYINQNKPKKAAVIGGGFIGLEMAENLHQLGIEVSIIEMANQMMNPIDYSMASIVHQHLYQKNIKCYFNNGVESFEQGYPHTIDINLKDGQQLNVDMVILSIGVKANSELAQKAGLQIGALGGITVNPYLQTSDEHIYAVGDVIEFTSPISQKPALSFLAGPANRQGRICADNIIFGNTTTYKGSIGTAIAKVFNLTVATTGMASKNLSKLGIDHITSITHSASHAGYYPGAIPMSIKLIFTPKTGQLLGAQIVGQEGVDKRIDLIATVLNNKGTIYDLIAIEHAYAPPYSSAKDPVNMAGYVAENILKGNVKVKHWLDIQEINFQNTLLIDTRTEAEFENGAIPGAINIPVDNLRQQLHQIPTNKTIIIYCAVGLRGYLANRILLQHGFKNVYNLSGGYKTWVYATQIYNNTNCVITITK